MRLEDKNGLPWTASTGLGWIVLLAVLTIGWANIALSLYLAIWIWSKGRSIIPLVGFFLSLLCLIPEIFLSASLGKSIVCIDKIFWFGAIFWLRHEVQAYFREREGWEPEISPWLTFFFSSIYINYCLNPVTLSDGRGSVTSLNLSNPEPK
jgi:hypothetical protein